MNGRSQSRGKGSLQTIRNDVLFQFLNISVTIVVLFTIVGTCKNSSIRRTCYFITSSICLSFLASSKDLNILKLLNEHAFDQS